MERKKFIDKIENSHGIDKIKEMVQYSTYLRQPDPIESVKIAKQALSISEESNFQKGIVNSLINIAYAYLYNSDFEKAGKWANKILKYGVKQKIPNSIGTAYNIKARIAHNNSDNANAISFLLKALDYYLEANNPTDLMSCYNNLGMVHLRIKDVKEAEQYLKLALKIAEDTDNAAQDSIRVNLGNVQFGQKKYREAIDIYKKSLTFFKNNDRNSDEASTLNNIGLCYDNLHEFENAIEFYLLSYDLRKKINDPVLLCETCYSTAGAYIQLNKLDKALLFLKESEKTSEIVYNGQNLVHLYDTYADYYTALKEHQKANQYLKKVINTSDKINKQNHQKQITELEAKYKTEIYKFQNEELDKKTKTMENQIKSMNQNLLKLKNTHGKLQVEFELAVDKMNTQDDMLSSQARMAVMGEMVSSIAHQWRQPLNIISLLSQGIGDAWQYDELEDDFLDKQIELITGQISYMNETINDFRNFFKPEFIEEFCIANVLEKSIKLVGYMLKRDEVTLEKDFDQNCQTSGNPNELIQVIINILNNAREAMNRNTGNHSHLKMKLACNDSYASISILNNGHLIKNENIEKLFEPYFTTRGDSGTGIGLYISKMIIVNKFHGNIEVKNHKDGVEFIINIANCKTE